MRSILITLLLCASAFGSDEPLAKRLIGSWKGVGGNADQLRFESERITWRKAGRLRFFRATIGESAVTVTRGGRKFLLPASFDAAGLLTVDVTRLPQGPPFPNGPLRFERLSKTPKTLILQPLAFPKPVRVEPEALATFRAELRRRIALDQAVRRDRSRWHEMGKVDADNTAWLKRQIARVGWIDATRFGARASDNAFLLVQHSADLPLMLAALPRIKVDVDAKRFRDGQPYALLYDRVQLKLAKRQRYGTQIGQGPKGGLVVLPLQDRAKVDEYRKQMRMGPLKDYLRFFERGGKKVRFLDPEPKPKPKIKRRLGPF